MGAIRRIYSWLIQHPRLVVSVAAFVLIMLHQVWPLFSAIPAAPSGRLQMVGIVSDSARYVAIDDRVEDDGKLRAIVLIVLDQTVTVDGVSFRSEAKKEWINCAKREIELEGAGFYDDQGKRVLTRYFDRKPEAAEPIAAEVAYLCQDEQFGLPTVTGYQAALQQERALRAEISKQAKTR